MSINIDQRRARNGSFIQKIGTVRTGSTRYYRYLNIINCKVIFSFCILLLTHGDIEANPRLTKKPSNYFSCCHWNANSILAHNKISLLTAYNIVQKLDIICISETYLDSTVYDKTIEIKGYNLIKADYPNNQKKGGVCLYFKGNLCLRQIDISYFSECLLCQININNKKAISLFYIDLLVTILDKILCDVKQLGSTFLITLDDFNAKSITW